MARTAYARREAYDNIAVGAAITTQERVIDGANAPAKDRTTFAHGERVYSATPGLERFIAGVAGATGERPGGA